MIVTIQIENQQDFQWLVPFLETLRNETSAKVEIKAAQNGYSQTWEQKLDDFFKFTRTHAAKVEKVEHLTRDELNER